MLFYTRWGSHNVSMHTFGNRCEVGQNQLYKKRVRLKYFQHSGEKLFP